MKHLGTKELYSKRLLLRKIIEADAEEIYNGFINQEEFLYYANKESKKIHLPSCHYAKSMSESKVRLEKDYSALIADGYSPCAICNPQ